MFKTLLTIATVVLTTVTLFTAFAPIPTHACSMFDLSCTGEKAINDNKAVNQAVVQPPLRPTAPETNNNNNNIGLINIAEQPAPGAVQIHQDDGVKVNVDCNSNAVVGCYQAAGNIAMIKGDTQKAVAESTANAKTSAASTDMWTFIIILIILVICCAAANSGKVSFFKKQ